MITDLTPESWDKKIIELSGSILQSWAWGEFQKSLNQKIYRFSGADFACLAIEENLPMNKNYIYSPRGPLGNVEAAMVDIKKLEDDHGLVFARIEPQQKISLPRGLKDPQPVNNWMLNLEKNEEELLIGMKPKTRYNINLAQRKGVTVKDGSSADLVSFFQLLLETAKRNQFKLHPQAYYFHMWDHLAPKNLKLLLAYYKDQLLAGMLLSTFGDTAVYLHGGSSQKLKETMAPYLLHWEAIKLSKQIGLKTYDFGGIAAEDSADRGWAGLSRFKKSFGGFEVVYPGSFDLIYSPIWYNVYKNARKLRGLMRR